MVAAIANNYLLGSATDNASPSLPLSHNTSDLPSTADNCSLPSDP
jgi:hypothetical protein